MLKLSFQHSINLVFRAQKCKKALAMNGICLIYNDINERPGSKIDSQKLGAVFQNLAIFGERLIVTETEDDLCEPDDSIEDDIRRKLKNLSNQQQIHIIIATATNSHL